MNIFTKILMSSFLWTIAILLQDFVFKMEQSCWIMMYGMFTYFIIETITTIIIKNDTSK